MLEIVLLIAVASALFFLWLLANFLLILDTLSFGSKVAWFLVLTLLALPAIPVYLVTRHRRHSQAANELRH